jgi:hypothetical protein
MLDDRRFVDILQIRKTSILLVAGSVPDNKVVAAARLNPPDPNDGRTYPFGARK